MLKEIKQIINNKDQEQQKSNLLRLNANHPEKEIKVKNNDLINLNKKLDRLHSFCLLNEEEEIEQDPDFNYYYKIIEYDNIGMGDLFGARGIYENQNEKRICRLAFLSDSFTCEIYKLERKNLCYIPEQLSVQNYLKLIFVLKRILIEGIKGKREFDEIDTKLETKKNENWVAMKQNIYQRELQALNNTKSYLSHYKKY